MLQKASYTWDFLVLNAKDFNLYRWSILKIIFYQRDMIWKYTDLKKKNQKYKRLNEINTSSPVSLSTKPTLYVRESGWQNTLKQKTNKDRFLGAAARIRRDTCKKHKCPKKSLSENEHDLYAESKWNWHTSVTVCFAWISHAQIFLDAPNMLLLHLTGPN